MLRPTSISDQTPAQSWREVQTLNPHSNRYIDAMTCQGEFSQSYIEEWNRLHPDDPKIFTNQPKVLFGGAGFGGKSHTIRACMVELHAVYLALGVTFPITAIISNSYPNLSQWQIMELRKNYRQWGEDIENHTFGLHFKFHDEAWGVCLLRNADKPDKRGTNILSAQIDEASMISWDIIEDIHYAVRGAGAPFNSLGFCSNPDGPHASKLKQLFVDRDFVEYEDRERDTWIRQQDFVPIIRSFVWDNPVATQADFRRLQGFGNDALNKARFEGDWEILTGLRFSQFSRKIHTFTWDDFCRGYDIPKWDDPAQYIRPENGFEVFGSLDYGTAATSASAFYLHAIDWKRRVWTFEELWLDVDSMPEGQQLPRQVLRISHLLKRFNVERVWVDPSLRGKDDDGLSRIDKFRDGFRALGCDTALLEGSRDRIERWATIDNLLHYARDPQPPHELLFEPQLKILRPGGGVEGCPKLIKFFENAPRHITLTGTKLEDVDPQGGKHHAGDSVSYFYHSYFHGGDRPTPDVQPGTEGYRLLLREMRRQKRQEAERW